jgi:predicted RND superfamily exporter protein
VASLALARLYLNLDTDWLVLFRSDRPEIATLQKWREVLPGSKDMAVIVSGGTLERRRQAALMLGEGFRDLPDLLEDPLYALPTEVFLDSGLYYLTQEKLRELDDRTAQAIVATRELDLQGSVELFPLAEFLSQTTAGSRMLVQGLDAFVRATSRDPEMNQDASLVPSLAPESKQLIRYLGDFREVPESVDLSLDGGRTLLVLVRPKIKGQLEEAAPAVAEVRKIVTNLRVRFKNLTFSLTGEPVLVVDERRTIARDSIRGTVCSFILVLVIFQFGFREFLRPTLALTCLVVGLLWTLGIMSLTIGRLNFITITYVPILIGLGLDFGIHMAFRYFENRGERDPISAVGMALDGAGRDTLYGALTTSASFGVLAVIGFRGVSELGTIALCGVLLCQMASCTFLPACLALVEAKGLSLPEMGRQEFEGFEKQICKLDRYFLLGTAAAVAFALALAPNVQFNVHLLKMQNPQLESVRTELALVAEGKSSVLTALIAVDDLEVARRLERELRQLDTVAEVISLSTFLPVVTPEKQKTIEDLLSKRDSLFTLLNFVKRVPSAEPRVALQLLDLYRALNLPDVEKQQVTRQLDLLQDHLSLRGPGPVMDALESLRVEALNTLDSFQPLLLRQVPRPLSAVDLPTSLTSRLLRRDGKFVLRVFPRVDIWQPENLKRFLDDVRGVHPEVSGEPVLIELFERLVMDTHWRGIGLSLLAMLVILSMILRDARAVFLAATPTALSLVIMMGLMGFFKWDFNPANFVAVPMLLGIGCVFGLHSMLRIRELGHDRILSCSTGPAILLSATTSMAGFASLGLADHRGIASLGWLVSMGLLINTFLSVVVLPAWIRMQKGKS